MITGLPRSRTAWWSVVATTAGYSHCEHEPLKNCSSFEDFKARFVRNDGVRYAGISDSGVVPLLGRILAEIGPRTLIVMRDQGEVCRSISDYLGFDCNESTMRYVQEASRELAKFVDHPLVEVVQFEDLSDEIVVEDCLRWLMPSAAGFNRELMHMNIQVERSYMLESVTRLNNLWNVKEAN